MHAALERLRRLAHAEGLECLDLASVPALVLFPPGVTVPMLRQAMESAAASRTGGIGDCEVSVAERQELFALFREEP